MIVNQTQLSEITGSARSAIQKWEKAGLPFVEATDHEKKYETREVIAWIIKKEIDKIRAQYDERPRDRHERLKADMVELQLQHKRGEIVYVSDIAPSLTRYIQDTAVEIDGLPDKYGHRLHGCDTVEQVIELLKEMCLNIRTALGSYEFSSATNPDGD